MDIKTIESLMQEIKSKYSNGHYIQVSGNTRLDRELISDELWALWYSDGNHSVAVCNIDDLLIKCKNNELDKFEFYEILQDLKNKLDIEFKRASNHPQ